MEVSIELMAYIFISRGLMFCMQSALVPSTFFSIVVSSSNLAASVFPPTHLLLLVCLIRYSKYLVYVEIFFFSSFLFIKTCLFFNLLI